MYITYLLLALTHALCVRSRIRVCRYEVEVCVCVCVCVCLQRTHKAGDVSEEPHRLVNGRSVLSAEIEALR